MDKKNELDIAPTPSHHHQEVAGTHHTGGAWATREPYGPAGMSLLLRTRLLLIHSSGFRGLFTNHYVALCAAFATIGGLLFGYEYAPPSNSQGSIY